MERRDEMNSFEFDLPEPCYKLKTVLINPKHAEWARTLPLGIAYIASVLEENGLHVDVIDMNVYRMDLIGYLKAKALMRGGS